MDLQLVLLSEDDQSHQNEKGQQRLLVLEDELSVGGAEDHRVGALSNIVKEQEEQHDNEAALLVCKLGLLLIHVDGLLPSIQLSLLLAVEVALNWERSFEDPTEGLPL